MGMNTTAPALFAPGSTLGRVLAPTAVVGLPLALAVVALLGGGASVATSPPAWLILVVWARVTGIG